MERQPGSLPPAMSASLLNDQHDVVQETKLLVNSVRVIPESEDEENVEHLASAAPLLHDTTTGEDPYFAEHPEEIDSDDFTLQVFDFDVSSIASADTRMFLFVLVLLSIVILWADSVDPIENFFAVDLLFLVPIDLAALTVFHRLRKQQTFALHVAVTAKGVVFVQERHPSWYGCKGHRRQFFPYRLIRSITYRNPTGDCCFGWEDTLSRIFLYHCQEPTTSIPWCQIPLLWLRGVKDAATFYNLVSERINAPDTEETGRD